MSPRQSAAATNDTWIDTRPVEHDKAARPTRPTARDSGDGAGRAPGWSQDQLARHLRHGSVRYVRGMSDVRGSDLPDPVQDVFEPALEPSARVVHGDARVIGMDLEAEFALRPSGEVISVLDRSVTPVNASLAQFKAAIECYARWRAVRLRRLARRRPTRPGVTARSPEDRRGRAFRSGLLLVPCVRAGRERATVSPCRWANAG